MPKKEKTEKQQSRSSLQSHTCMDVACDWNEWREWQVIILHSVKYSFRFIHMSFSLQITVLRFSSIACYFETRIYSFRLVFCCLFQIPNPLIEECIDRTE